MSGAGPPSAHIRLGLRGPSGHAEPIWVGRCLTAGGLGNHVQAVCRWWWTSDVTAMLTLALPTIWRSSSKSPNSPLSRRVDDPDPSKAPLMSQC